MLRDQSTIRMVAAYWGCSTKTVRHLIETGALTCVRTGGVIRVTRDQVAAYEAEHGAVTAVPQSDLDTRLSHEQAADRRKRSHRYGRLW